MPKITRKHAFLVAKLLVAAVLLTWVFSQVHWDDYVQAKVDNPAKTDRQAKEGGKTYPVVKRPVERPGELELGRARPWEAALGVCPVTDFVPIPGTDQVVRDGLRSSLLHMNRLLLGLALGGFLIQVLIVAVRWWFLLRIQDIHIPLWESVRLTFLGQFFNVIVPGTVGGDLVKAWYVAKHTPKKAAVLVSVFVDRVMGLTELTLMAAVMVTLVSLGLLGQHDPEKLRRPIIAVACVACVVVGAMTFLLSSWFRRIFHLQKIYQRLPIAHHIAAAGEAARLYRRRIGALAKAILITIGAHVFFVGAIALLGLSLRLDTPWYNYFIYVPLIYILGAIPLTPGGAGLVEGLYVAFFASAVCGQSEIVALALLARLIPIFWGLPGVIVAITGPKLPKAAAIQAELEEGT